MGKDRNGKRERNADGRGETVWREEEEEEENKVSGDKKHVKSKRRIEHASYSGSVSRGSESSESEEDRRCSRSNRRRSSSRRKSRGRYSDEESDSYSGSSSCESDSDTDESETEEERRRRKRKERKKREEREKDKDRKKRRKGRERKSGRDGEEERKRSKKKKEKEKKMKKDKGKKGAVTNSWGKYGTIREIDMWNKRPEFTAWLAEVKEVNLESLPNWEEKKMFKEYMEDYNTATLPSKKYYNLDYYHKKKMQKQMKKGLKQIGETERTIFNDEEQRRLELMREREKHKLKEVEALKNAMQAGMAQDMKEQARLREEMQYLYKVGNYEAAAAIQRKLDPDVAM